MTPAHLKLVPPSAIPAELRAKDRWLAWRLIDDKKCPVDYRGPLEIRGVAKAIKLAPVPLSEGARAEGQRDFEGARG